MMEFEDILVELSELVDPANICKYLYENNYKFPVEIKSIDSDEFIEVLEEIKYIDISDLEEEDDIINSHKDFIKSEIEYSLKDNFYKDHIDVESAVENCTFNLDPEDLGYTLISVDIGDWRYSYYINK